MKINYKEWAYRFFCVFSVIAIVILGAKIIFPIILPFLISYLLVIACKPMSEALCKRLKINKKISIFIVLIFVLIVLALFLLLLGNKLYVELIKLTSKIADIDVEKIIQNIKNFVLYLREKIPLLDLALTGNVGEDIVDSIDNSIRKTLSGVLLKLTNNIPSMVGQVLLKLPNIFLFVIVTFVSAVYFAFDINAVDNLEKKLLKEERYEKLKKLKSKLKGSLKQCLFAYFLIFLFTFAILLVGFLILRVDFAFSLALFVAFVDFLPILGTGTILIPYGIVMIIQKNYYIGFGLLLLYAVITIARQFVEPKIIGKSIGLHPLLTLVALYFGYSLFGFFGMILSPIVLLIVYPLIKKGTD